MNGVGFQQLLQEANYPNRHYFLDSLDRPSESGPRLLSRDSSKMCPTPQSSQPELLPFHFSHPYQLQKASGVFVSCMGHVQIFSHHSHHCRLDWARFVTFLVDRFGDCSTDFRTKAITWDVQRLFLPE